MVEHGASQAAHTESWSDDMHADQILLAWHGRRTCGLYDRCRSAFIMCLVSHRTGFRLIDRPKLNPPPPKEKTKKLASDSSDACLLVDQAKSMA